MKSGHSQRRSFTAAALVVGALACSACGGGGGGSGTAAAGSVSAAASVGAAKYGQTLQLSLTGSQLDQGLTVAATGCGPATLDAAHSNATSALYSCTVSALGAGQWSVTRKSDGAVLATTPFTVPVPQVTLSLSIGSAASLPVVITLAPDKAPITVTNFLAYVNSGFYDGTVFSRVVPNFIVQGGGYSAPLDATTQTLKATAAPIALEVGKGLGNTQWTVAMARLADDTSTATATSQFFINLADNSASLDPGLTAGYAVFGVVTSGTGNVSSIVAAPCTPLAFSAVIGGDPTECTPIPNVVIESAVQTQ